MKWKNYQNNFRVFDDLNKSILVEEKEQKLDYIRCGGNVKNGFGGSVQRLNFKISVVGKFFCERGLERVMWCQGLVLGKEGY